MVARQRKRLTRWAGGKEVDGMLDGGVVKPPDIQLVERPRQNLTYALRLILSDSATAILIPFDNRIMCEACP
jgi:hypothetical protein